MAVLLMTFTLAGHVGVPRHVRWLGYGTGFSGMLLAVAGFAGLPVLLAIASGSTIVGFMAWAVSSMRAVARGRIGSNDATAI